jgi:hypothetical protein
MITKLNNLMRDADRARKKKDWATYARLMGRAADLDDSRALYEIGHWTLEGYNLAAGQTVIKRNISQGIELLSRAAAAGNVDACLVLGTWYLKNIRGKSDTPKTREGVKLLERAAGLGEASAACNLSVHWRLQRNASLERLWAEACVRLSPPSERRAAIQGLHYAARYLARLTRLRGCEKKVSVNVGSRLTTAIKTRSIMRIHRSRIDKRTLEAFVLQWNDDWTLLQTVSDRIDLDGYDLVRTRDISKVEISPESAFYQRSLIHRGQGFVKPLWISLLPLPDMMLSICRLYDAVMIERENVAASPVVGFIQKLADDVFCIRRLLSNATWKADRYRYKYVDVTRLTFGRARETLLCELSKNARG